MSENGYERYSKLRDLAGYKDAEVARGAGITKSTFSDWKNGRYIPKQEKLQKIADFLQIDIIYLTGADVAIDNMEIEKIERRIRLAKYAEKLMDLNIDPDALESLIDAVERMQKKD